MPQRTVIESLPEAMNIVKEMKLHDPEWNPSDWRSDANRALKTILEDRMRYGIDSYLDELSRSDSLPDRRNGSYKRYLLTELGEVELDVYRTRRFSAAGVLRAYARRSESVDRMILGCFFARSLHPQGIRGVVAGTGRERKRIDGKPHSEDTG